jgi:hypothetical protein
MLDEVSGCFRPLADIGAALYFAVRLPHYGHSLVCDNHFFRKNSNAAWIQLIAATHYSNHSDVFGVARSFVGFHLVSFKPMALPMRIFS